MFKKFQKKIPKKLKFSLSVLTHALQQGWIELQGYPKKGYPKPNPKNF